MQQGRHKISKVKITTFNKEQNQKDDEFIRLAPAERLKLHEIIRKRIWGDKYGTLVLRGLKVKKRKSK